MKLARVVATVVSTIHSPAFAGRRLLLCDLLDAEGRPTGGYTIAIDRVDAGAGETVLVLDEGNSARQMLAAPDAPVRAIVAGIVDEVSLEPEEDETYEHSPESLERGRFAREEYARGDYATLEEVKKRYSLD